jgi:hypothetical protein
LQDLSDGEGGDADTVRNEMDAIEETWAGAGFGEEGRGGGSRVEPRGETGCFRPVPVESHRHAKMDKQTT